MPIPFGFDGPHGTDTRPAHKDAVKLWAKDESAPGVNDGTRLTAALANAIVGNLRHFVTTHGITGPESSDTLVAQAVQVAISAALDDFGIDDIDGLTAALAAKATQAYVDAAVDAAKSQLLGGAPAAALDTLTELAAALADDASFASSMTTALAGKVATSRTISAAGLATGGGDLTADRTITVPVASQAEAEAGTVADKAMTPQRTAQAIAALVPAGAVPAGSVGSLQIKGSGGFDAAPWGYDSVDQTLKPAASNTYDIGLFSGAKPRNLHVTNSFAGGYYFLNTNGQIAALAPGWLRMTNHGGSDFNMLSLGPETASFPAIKRDGATLRARLGNDSADTSIRALNTAKAWVVFTGSTGSIIASHGVSSVTRVSAGGWEINLPAGTFGSSDYVAAVTIRDTTYTNYILFERTTAISARSATLFPLGAAYNAGATWGDPDRVMVVFYGA